jgi:hypothetical protein
MALPSPNSRYGDSAIPAKRRGVARFSLLHASAPVETGLDGWGGRIRNFAFRMIVIEPERFRRRAALKPAP